MSHYLGKQKTKTLEDIRLIQPVVESSYYFCFVWGGFQRTRAVGFIVHLSHLQEITLWPVWRGEIMSHEGLFQCTNSP